RHTLPVDTPNPGENTGNPRISHATRFPYAASIEHDAPTLSPWGAPRSEGGAPMTLQTATEMRELPEAAVQAFAQSLRGQLIRRGDPDYDEARKVYNAMIDKHPLMIARCVDVADVIESVNFAREHGLLLAVRSGGHNGVGLGVCD